MKLSIITPVYKIEEKILAKCIESILNQIFTDFELILVDDGSPDNCGKICDKYAELDNRVKVIHKNNGGVSSARNAGITIARGEYISFVDSDDWIEKNFYEEMINYATKNNLDMVVSGFVKDVNGSRIEVLKKIQKQIFSSQEAVKTLLERKVFVWSLWDKIYKTSLINEKCFFDESISMGEDLDFLWKIFKKTKSIGYIPLKAYHYCFRENSATNIVNPCKKIDSVKVMKKFLLEREYYNKFIYVRLRELYVKELASCIKNMLIFDAHQYKKEIISFQNELRKNIFSLYNNKDFSLFTKVGIIYCAFPFRVCKFFNRLIQ